MGNWIEGNSKNPKNTFACLPAMPDLNKITAWPWIEVNRLFILAKRASVGHHAAFNRNNRTGVQLIDKRSRWRLPSILINTINSAITLKRDWRIFPDITVAMDIPHSKSSKMSDSNIIDYHDSRNLHINRIIKDSWRCSRFMAFVALERKLAMTKFSGRFQREQNKCSHRVAMSFHRFYKRNGHLIGQLIAKSLPNGHQNKVNATTDRCRCWWMPSGRMKSIKSGRMQTVVCEHTPWNLDDDVT